MKFANIIPANSSCWQRRRIACACNTFLRVLDPAHRAEALSVDDPEVDLDALLSSHENHRKFLAFVALLTGEEAEKRSIVELSTSSKQDADKNLLPTAGAPR